MSFCSMHRPQGSQASISNHGQTLANWTKPVDVLVFAIHLRCCEVKQPNLKLKTWPNKTFRFSSCSDDLWRRSKKYFFPKILFRAGATCLINLYAFPLALVLPTQVFHRKDLITPEKGWHILVYFHPNRSSWQATIMFWNKLSTVHSWKLGGKDGKNFFLIRCLNKP